MPARLNVFSPLPPLRSEIGNHTLLVARALRERAEVTLWTPQAEPPEMELDVPVVCFDPGAMDWARLNRADANIYNIGNNATYHQAIFDVARRAPGLVVLHDLRLQHFFARYSERPGPDRTYYLQAMRRTHGPEALADARSWLAGEQGLDGLVERYPMTAAALDGALAAIVHNPAECDGLRSRTRTPVFHLPLCFDAGPPPRRVAAEGAVRLVAFGFIGPNRRLATLLDVLATLPGHDVRLDIYGALDEPEPVDRQIARLGLSARVSRHGFVPETELQAALLSADLAVNLRYPSMGEASGSQLRIWAAGLTSAVTHTGWYATLPGDTVCFVDPQREAESLREHLLALCRDRAPFRAAGLRGRALVEQAHTPEAYAHGLLDIVADLGGLHARREAIGLSQRATRCLLETAGVGGVGLAAAGVAAAIASLSGGVPAFTPAR